MAPHGTRSLLRPRTACELCVRSTSQGSLSSPTSKSFLSCHESRPGSTQRKVVVISVFCFCRTVHAVSLSTRSCSTALRWVAPGRYGPNWSSAHSKNTVMFSLQPRLYPTSTWISPPSRFGSRTLGGNQAYLAIRPGCQQAFPDMLHPTLPPADATTLLNGLLISSQLGPIVARWGRGSYGLLHLHSCNLRCGWPRGGGGREDDHQMRVESAPTLAMLAVHFPPRHTLQIFQPHVRPRVCAIDLPLYTSETRHAQQ